MNNYFINIITEDNIDCHCDKFIFMRVMSKVCIFAVKLTFNWNKQRPPFGTPKFP